MVKSLQESLDRMKRLMIISENVETQTFNLEALSQMPSFAQRVKYCSLNLQRISSGSSRIVYHFDQDHAIKLAKNPRGIAQNGAEGDGYVQTYHSDIIARIVKKDPDYKWIIVEKAEKARVADFKQLLGLPFQTIQRFMFYLGDKNDPAFRDTHFEPGEVQQLLEDHPFLVELEQLIANLKMSPYDFGKTSSYGVVNRNGQRTIVLIDYGLTNKIYDTMYEEE